MKQYCMSKKKALAEHMRIVPELEKAGLKKEAKTQKKDLKEIKAV